MQADDPFQTEYSEIPPPTRMLGDYRILGQLGRGGMGIVYEAEAITGGPRVALKTLHRGSSAALARFKSEFRVLADLAHPTLVRLGELVTTASEPFFTMEIVRGLPIDQHVRSTFESNASAPFLPFNELRLREAFGQLAEGLAALHTAGCLHRDLKPSNVLVTHEGRVVVLDLGLAVQTDDEQRYRNSRHELAGTVYFMAPEQAEGGRLTAATDWYAVGVMLYEALTGERVFRSKSFADLLQEKLTGQRPEPRQIVADVPIDLNDLCLALLRPVPADRAPVDDVLRSLRVGVGPTRNESVWIGRQSQLAALEAAWSEVRDGDARVVFVSGRSGMGKTSLVDHFLMGLRQREPVIILRGRCYENESVAYQGFDSAIDALASYLSRLPAAEVERVLPLEIDTLCQIFPVIGEVPAVGKQRSPRRRGGLSPREERLIGLTALRELLSRLARWSPLILFIDDLQQGDDDTATLFRELFRREVAPAALVVGTFRSEDAATNECLRQIRQAALPAALRDLLVDQQELSVDRLDRSEAIAMAVRLLARAPNLGRDLAERIADEADGDPLFIRLLCEHLLRHQADPSMPELASGGRWSLQSVIWNQISRLEASERRAMELLTAAGRPLDRQELETMLTSHSDSPAIIRSLRINHLVRRLGDHRGIEIFHDKIRETIAARLPADRVAEHCLAIASQLDRHDGGADIEFLADLYRRGGEKLRAGEYYAQAAKLAESSLAFHRAVQDYRRALELLEPTGSREQQLRTDLAGALSNSSRAAEAAEQYLLAAELAPPDEKPRLTQLAAMRLLTSGHVDQGVEALQSVLRHYRLPWPRTTLSAVPGLLWRAAWLRVRGLSARGTPVPGDRNQQARLDACWSAAAGLSVVDPVRGAYFVADNLCRSLRQGSSATIGRDLAAYVGHLAIGGSRSRSATRRALLAIRSQRGQQDDPYSRAMLLMGRGIAALLRGDWSATIGCCDRAVTKLVDGQCFGATWELSTARTFSLWALQYQGNLVELARRQPELMREAEETNDLFATLNFGTQVMAHLQLAAGQPEESLRRLERDRQRLSNRGFFVQHHNYWLASTYTLLYLGRGHEALRCIEGQWRNYRSAFLSQVQQIRVDHFQVYARAILAAAAEAPPSSSERRELLTRARAAIRRLKAERVGWSTALALALEASLAQLSGSAEEAATKLREAEISLAAADMRLFAAAAKVHLNSTDDAFSVLGATAPREMAAMLIPGFSSPVKVE